MHWRRKWQPTPALLPGESQGRSSLVGCCLWGRTESDMTEVTQQQQQFLTIAEEERGVSISSLLSGIESVSHSVVSNFLQPQGLQAHQPPLSMEFSKQEYCSWLPFPSPGDLPGPRIEPVTPVSPSLQVDSLPTKSSGSPPCLSY